MQKKQWQQPKIKEISVKGTEMNPFHFGRHGGGSSHGWNNNHHGGGGCHNPSDPVDPGTDS
ncbi:MAG: hypothetical protein FWC60_02980 [Firmicutes bacterium]|nr:hypothetical protein [Bacillota bacterium]